MDGSHYQIVAGALAGDRPVDERALTSVAILAERIEHLKGQSPLFAGIEFSPDVKKMKQRCEPMTIA